MFTLELYDRKGVKLNIGDLVKVSDGHHFSFFAEVTFLEHENAIAPFHTFTFHSFEKIDKLPDNVEKSTIEERYNVWYSVSDKKEIDEQAANFARYLHDWRQCERLIDDGCFRIKLQKQLELF